MIACSSRNKYPSEVKMSNCCHRCNYHLEALARSTQRNIPVTLLTIHLPPPSPGSLSGSSGDFVQSQRSAAKVTRREKKLQRGSETSRCSLDFYLFPLASRISINRNFPLLSKNCVIGAAWLMSLRRPLEVLAFFSQEIGPRRRRGSRLHGGKAEEPR